MLRVELAGLRITPGRIRTGWARAPRGRAPLVAAVLAADAQTLDERLVAVLVDLLDVVEEAAPGLHHFQQPASRMVVLGVAFEVLGEVGDALGEDRDLHLGRTGIALLGGIFRNEHSLALRRNRHRVILSN